MGSATIQAIATGREALTAARGTGLALGRDLFTAQRTLAASAPLRAALADAAAEPSSKTSIVDRVFASLGTGARSVLRTVAGARWSSDEDLVAGVEELAIRAIAAGAPKTVSIVDELALFGRAVDSDPELEFAVGSKLVPAEQKADIVARLLKGKASEATIAILTALVTDARGRRIGELLRTASRLVADADGKTIATVQTARPLSAAQTKRLESALAASQGRPVAINQVVDPSLVGGLKVVIGDTVIDGSVATKLSDLRLALAG